MMKTTTRKNETTINRRIELLEKQSDMLREELEGELNLAKKRVTDVGKVALGIGGGLLLSMLILRMVFPKKDGHEERPHNRRVYHKFKDQLLGEISSQALLFILGVAKDKIRTHLEQEKGGKE